VNVNTRKPMACVIRFWTCYLLQLPKIAEQTPPLICIVSSILLY